jgi:hypothetical protein
LLLKKMLYMHMDSFVPFLPNNHSLYLNEQHFLFITSVE